MEYNGKYAEGSIHNSVNYGKFVVIKYTSSRKITLEFLDTGYTVTVRGDAIKSGKIKDKLRPSIHGFGFVGVGKQPTSVAGKTTSAYGRWERMLARCYQETHKHYKYYGGRGVTVCEEWRNFQNFSDWYLRECSKLNISPDNKEYEIDKDISCANIYSPETCQLITVQSNSEVSKAKHYKFINPEGEVVEVYNLRKFCRDNDLAQSHMWAVHNHEAVSHKLWTKA
ncbi:HNH endonuclease [Vibrio phage K404]|nr:hypothetical protein SIPHO068v1_p0056 [Vibrio phage 51E28.4]QZI92643.1 hypothetical protein SIPHO059v1_p0048 [Vibrio phage 264E42.1]